MRVVPAIAAAAIVAKVTLRHAWAAHPAALLGGAAGTVALTAAVAVSPVSPLSPAHPSSHAAVPVPAATAESAVPAASPGITAVSGPSGGLKKGTRGRTLTSSASSPRLPALSPPGVPVAVTPPAATVMASQPSQPSSLPQQPGPSQQSAPAGVIQADTDLITVTDPAQLVQVAFTATGGDVNWHAWLTGPSAGDVTLDRASGFTPAGTADYVTLTIDPAAQATGGSVVLHIWPGDVQVRISWQAVPAPAGTPTGPVPSPS